jgi:glycosyltransferase involved in cell wall biosynthesis
MRIVIWHGYLLGGTGSNVYTREMAKAWARAGHEVIVLCQEPHPDQFDLAGAVIKRPPLPGRLPVFVLDRYEDAEAALLPDMARAEVDEFVEANAAAIREQGPVDLLLTNHVLLGAPVGAASGLPYVVKAHGSELEFAMRGNPALGAWARELLPSAIAVLAGSDHIVRVLTEVVGPDVGTVRVVPPGVDVHRFRPRDRGEALAALLAECELDDPNPADNHNERKPDEGNAERLGDFFAAERHTVLYVGKLSTEKGVRLLLDAMAGMDARCVITGFGPERAALQAAAGPSVVFTGPLEHRHLAQLWPLADVSVTPSIFPEAFGMVAAEAAACGSPPLVARHSGLAEIAAGLEQEYPERLRHLAAFERGDGADLKRRLAELLALPAAEWQELSEAGRRAVVNRWSWEQIGQQIIDLLPGGAVPEPSGGGRGAEAPR